MIEFGDRLFHRITGRFGVCVGAVAEESNFGRILAVAWQGEFEIVMVAEADVRKDGGWDSH